jgi:hypothetical protein
MFLRGVSMAIMMVALLLVYRVHPAAGWSALAALATSVALVGHPRHVHA